MSSSVTSTSPVDQNPIRWIESRLNALPVFVKFVGLMGQLGLLVVASHLYGIQDEAFNDLLKLTWFGFVIHSALPMQFRLPFFALLSASGIVLVLGPENAAYVMGLGLGLIGICHLPLPIQARVALLLATGVALAFMRVELIEAPWSGAIWPVLCSMFMFRLIIYLYDMHHDKDGMNPARTFSYFFMLPNVCFPLFPVVDYKRSIVAITTRTRSRSTSAASRGCIAARCIWCCIGSSITSW